MKQSESIAKLAVALVAAQGELRPITKDAKNPHFNSKFASLDGIIEQVRPILASHGLAVVQGTTTPESDANAKATAFTVETTILHESGEWVRTAVMIPLQKADPQGAGSALTYGRRYGLSAALSLATDEDDDGNNGSKPAKAQRSTKASAPSMLVGKHKGEAISAQSVETLRGALTWCKADPKREKDFAAFIVQLETALEDKSEGGVTGPAGTTGVKTATNGTASTSAREAATSHPSPSLPTTERRTNV